MGYSDYELSQHSGQPVEAYLFQGTFNTYRYTSADSDQVIDGQTFIAIPIKRETVRSGSQGEDSLDLRFEVPADLDVVQDYAYNISPPDLVITVYRVHVSTDFATEWQILWKGNIASFTIADNKATIQVPSIFSYILNTIVPDHYFQPACNHVLYDNGCQLSRGTFTTAATVVTVSDTAIQVNNDGNPDNFLATGEIVHVASGERRLILSNVVNVIRISFPFSQMQIGDSVQLVAGCDHSFTTCKSKFNNSEKFGGFPFVPWITHL